MSAELLARYALQRRRDLRLSQQEVADRGGPSVATTRVIETGRTGNLRPRKANELDRALAWKLGTTFGLLHGEISEPVEADPEHRGDSDFGSRVRDERVRRGLSIEEAARRGRTTFKTWQRIESDQPIQDFTLSKVDAAFGFELGTAHAISRGTQEWPAVARVGADRQAVSLPRDWVDQVYPAVRNEDEDPFLSVTHLIKSWMPGGES